MTAIAEGLTHWSESPLLNAVDRLLRDGPGTLQRIERGQQLGLLAKAMILTIAIGAASFGASMGAYRGGVQILYAAVKLPLAVLLSAALCAPALSTLNAALGRPVCLRRDLALVLCALARTSLVLAAQSPLLLMAVRFGVGYHELILLAVACCALAGIVGLVMLIRGLRAAPHRGPWLVAAGLLVVFGVVGTQMAWTLRPFILRPRTTYVPFVRSLEGNFFEAVSVAVRSARGDYFRDAAPLPDERGASDARDPADTPEQLEITPRQIEEWPSEVR
jgi:hypothetical protein